MRKFGATVVRFCNDAYSKYPNFQNSHYKFLFGINMIVVTVFEIDFFLQKIAIFLMLKVGQKTRKEMILDQFRLVEYKSCAHFSLVF